MTEPNYGLFDANNNTELQAARAAAKDKCQEYNALKFSDAWGQRALLRELLGSVGENAMVLAPFWCDYGKNISIGRNFFSNHNLVILDGAAVAFGDNVFIGPNCSFYTAGHPLDAERRSAGLEYAWPITVGNDVWIGGGVTVCPGVSIGSNVVIAAGAVVTEDVPDNCIAGGNPCKVIRTITEADAAADYAERYREKFGR